MKIVFLDAEYTGEHAATTLVSLGLVTLEGDELYVELNDYDEGQVSDWLRENVLALLDGTSPMTSRQAYEALSRWLSDYAKDDVIHLCSAGKTLDIMLLFELFRFACPGRSFHYLHCLPRFLNHAAHFDLNTMMLLSGIDPNSSRAAFVTDDDGSRHHALHDARIVRRCFLKLVEDERFGALRDRIERHV